MTYRMLLVDDEPTVTDWLNYLLTETFGSGVELYRFNESYPAMKFIEENPIDIAVLDINMPVAGGMEMLEFISDKRPESRVIFLTGFDQFEYAKNAVHPQVTAYILKNEEDEALLDGIRRAMRQIDEECRRQRLVEMARRRLDASAPALRRECLMRLIHGAARPEDGLPVRLAIDESAPFCLLCCDAGRHDAAPQDLGTVFAAGLAVEEALGASYTYESIMPDSTSWLWLLQPSDGTVWEPESFQALRSALEEAQMSFHRQTRGNLCFMVLTQPVTLRSLMAAWLSLRPLRSLAPAGTHAVLTDGDLPDAARPDRRCAEPGEYEPAMRAAPALQRLLEQGGREEFHALLQRLVQPLMGEESAAGPVAGEAYMAAASVLLSYINRMSLAQRLPEELSVQKLCRRDLCGSGPGAAAFLLRLGDALFDMQESRRAGRAALYVQKARKYISEHLDEDLSLISVSERVMLNPSYFSSLFKMETGANLSDYIKNERLDRAKALLAEKSYRINEIARMTGYGNAAYFTRFFKNETGRTPVEYRNDLP